MAGNLAEWCIDNHSTNFAWDSSGDNPVHLSDENLPHVVKGGSGLHDADCLRCSSRDYYSPSLRDNIVGMRCVKIIAED
jgi:formylglycine-generating enzyme required for sulfatase activity